MEKEIIVWTFIVVFVVTSTIAILGIIKNVKWIEIDEKYLKVLLRALILEVVAVIVAFGASAFNEMSLESRYKKEIESLTSDFNDSLDTIDELNVSLAEAKKEIELKNEELIRVRKEKQELTFTLEQTSKAEDKKKENVYTFQHAKWEFSNKPIYFIENTANIDSLSKDLLSSAAEKLGKYKDLSLRLHPVTPWSGDDTLVLRRQESIRTYLISKGFLPHNIIFVTNSRYGNESDEIRNENNVLIEKGMLLELQIKAA